MRFSARNQLSGTVIAVHQGAVNASIDLRLPSRTTIVAQVTLASIDFLGLSIGTVATALIKSSWVTIGIGETEPKVSCRNRLKGTVEAVAKGAIQSEIHLILGGGERLVASITNESVENLDLKTGDTAWALFKASAVILGV